MVSSSQPSISPLSLQGKGTGWDEPKYSSLPKDLESGSSDFASKLRIKTRVKSTQEDKPNLLRGWICLVLAALQVGLQPIMTRAFIPRSSHKATVVMISESFKAMGAISSLLIEDPVRGKNILSNWNWRTSLSLAGPPAAIYAVQNVVIQIATQNVDPLTFNILNQTKIVFTAVMLYVIMGRRQSRPQCVALVLVLLAGTLLCLPKQAEAEIAKAGEDLELEGEAVVDATTRANSFFWGIVPAILSAIMSGTATVVCQKVMQGKTKRNAYLFTGELASIGVLTLLTGQTLKAFAAFARTGSVVSVVDPTGLTGLSLIPCLTNAFGGIVVGQVVKNLGGILKAYALIGGIVLTAFLQMAMYAEPLSAELLLALPLTVVSLFVYTNYPLKKNNAKNPAVSRSPGRFDNSPSSKSFLSKIQKLLTPLRVVCLFGALTVIFVYATFGFAGSSVSGVSVNGAYSSFRGAGGVQGAPEDVVSDFMRSEDLRGQ